MGKVNYEKPAAVDLGPTARIVGASCGVGEEYGAEGFCVSVGNLAGNDCRVGNGAGDDCQSGDSPAYDCGVGIGEIEQ